MKKFFLVGIVIIGIILADIVFISMKNRSFHAQQSVEGQKYGGKNSSLILFYCKKCSHCGLVDDFIEKNDISHKLPFERREVSNKENFNLLMQAAKGCHIKKDDLGVPFLWDGAECLMGDYMIIDYFNRKIRDK